MNPTRTSLKAASLVLVLILLSGCRLLTPYRSDQPANDGNLNERIQPYPGGDANVYPGPVEESATGASGYGEADR